MNYKMFKDLCSVYAVPVHHRQFCRELRPNPLATTNGYEEVYDIKDIPGQERLAAWLERSYEILKSKGEAALKAQFCKEESFRLRLPVGDPTVVAAADKKLRGFLTRASRALLRGMAITTRVDKTKPRATAVTEAIMALHAGKVEDVKEFILTIAQAEDQYGPEVQFEAEEILEQGLPFEATLDLLERMELSHIPNLPEFIGVDPFQAEEVVDGVVCGGKHLDNGFITDCEGKFVGVLFWDEDIEDGSLDHSPSQDRVEERLVQAYFKRREDLREEANGRLCKALDAKQKGLQFYKEYCKVAFKELKERAKVLAASGVHINVTYQARKEGLDLALVA